MRDLITIGFIHFVTFLVIFLIQKKYGFLSITELVLVGIITSLLTNGIYVMWSVIRAKQKSNQELRLDTKNKVWTGCMKTMNEVIYEVSMIKE